VLRLALEEQRKNVKSVQPEWLQLAEEKAVLEKVGSCK